MKWGASGERCDFLEWVRLFNFHSHLWLAYVGGGEEVMFAWVMLGLLILFIIFLVIVYDKEED